MNCPCLNILLSSAHEIGNEDCVLVLGRKTDDSLNLAAELGTNGKRADRISLAENLSHCVL